MCSPGHTARGGGAGGRAEHHTARPGRWTPAARTCLPHLAPRLSPPSPRCPAQETPPHTGPAAPGSLRSEDVGSARLAISSSKRPGLTAAPGTPPSLSRRHPRFPSSQLGGDLWPRVGSALCRPLSRCLPFHPWTVQCLHRAPPESCSEAPILLL